MENFWKNWVQRKSRDVEECADDDGVKDRASLVLVSDDWKNLFSGSHGWENGDSYDHDDDDDDDDDDAVPDPEPDPEFAAEDDFITTDEDTPVTGNLLDNDNVPAGALVTAVEGGTVGETFSVDIGGARFVDVTVEEDGTFTAVAGVGMQSMNEGDLESFVLAYTVTAQVEGIVERVIDFEGLAAGTIVSDQFEGVTIEGERKGDKDDINDAMIFDSQNPTGGDDDLGLAPEQGNILIISEGDGDHDDDNGVSGPDDNAKGGELTSTFDDLVLMKSLTFIDNEKRAYITLYDARGKKIDKIKVDKTDNGEVLVQEINVDGVAKAVVKLKGSGAIDDLIFEGPGLVDKIFEAEVTVEIEGRDDNAPPFINEPLKFIIDENETEVGTLQARDFDGDALTFELGTSGDSGLLQIDVITGALSFRTAPDFENQQDLDGDNIYEYEVSVSDGIASTTAFGEIRVTDLVENEAPLLTKFTDFFYFNGQNFRTDYDIVNGEVVVDAGQAGPNVLSRETGLIGELTAVDADGDTLSFKVMADPTSTDHAMFEIVNGNQVNLLEPLGDATDSNDDMFFSFFVEVSDALGATDVVQIHYEVISGA